MVKLEALERVLAELSSSLMLGAAQIADRVRREREGELLDVPSPVKKEKEYNLRLAQFVMYHFVEMDWQARLACDKGPDPMLHRACEHWRDPSEERAKDDYSEVLNLRDKVHYLNEAIRKSESDVEAKELNEELNETSTLLQDRLTTMATKYHFDGNVALCDQAMSILVRYADDDVETPGNLAAFFKACGTEYNPAETSELLAFFQEKHPDA